MNKQLMRAFFGTFNPTAGQPDLAPTFSNVSLTPLCEVDVIEELPGGGYAVHFDQQTAENYRDAQEGRARRQTIRKVLTARRVILAAGTLGSTEIMLRSKARGSLRGLSERTGCNFSTNGDYIAFLERTKERVSLVRGPVTTSFGHFHTKENGTSNDPSRPENPVLFHTLEDQGIPPASVTSLGYGVPLLHSLANGHPTWWVVIKTFVRFLLKRAAQTIRQLMANHLKRGEIFRSEEEVAANMMCVVAMGREASVGRFRLGTERNETALRIEREDKKEFFQDPIYDEVRKSLDKLAGYLADPNHPKRDFFNPFLTDAADALAAKSIALSHPLGGCPMGETVSHGVVNERGQVFDQRKGATGVYAGLYIADAAIIPTALGVNPSLTISALALRISDHIIEQIRSEP